VLPGALKKRGIEAEHSTSSEKGHTKATYATKYEAHHLKYYSRHAFFSIAECGATKNS
jgi:hypothetical protein